jgi:hypothetical protein
MGNLLQPDTAEVCGKGRSERSLSAALTRVGTHPGDVAVSIKGTPFARTARSIERACDRLAAQFDVRRVRHRPGRRGRPGSLPPARHPGPAAMHLIGKANW